MPGRGGRQGANLGSAKPLILNNMKIIALAKRIVPVLLLAILGGGALTLWAVDTSGSRPTLAFQTDNKPIDRDAPEPMSHANIVKKVSPSVVYIASSKTVRQAMPNLDLNDPAIRRFFGGNLRGRMVPRDIIQHSLGSGIIVSSDGYILTNDHVIDGADEVTVSFGEPRKEYPATIVGRDSKVDVAVLKIDATGLPAVTLGNSDQLQVGDTVFAIGDPFGIGLTVTHGIVSALGRSDLGIEAYEDFIQTDAPINPGNSGGALIDAAGRVVGLNTAILSQTGEFNGVGFAIPINMAQSVAEQIVNKGKVERAFLGIGLQALSPDLATQFGVAHGALVTSVLPGSPAEGAGLKNGDVITKFNGQEINNPSQLVIAVGNATPNTEVSVEYSRAGKVNTAKAKLTTQPASLLSNADEPPANQPKSGMATRDNNVLDGVTVMDITPPIRYESQLPPNLAGAVVTNVEPGTASARSGLEAGDIITELDRKPVANAGDAVKIGAEVKGTKVVLLIWRDGTSRYMVVDESK